MFSSFFFIKLTEMCLDMLTNQNLNKMGEKMFIECQNRIESLDDLYKLLLKSAAYQKNPPELRKMETA